jgi:hypothetical protein
VSIIVEVRTCDCGRPFRAVSSSKLKQCWPCWRETTDREVEEHAAAHASAMVAYSAEHEGEDPFLTVDGGELSSMRNTGKLARGDLR